MSQAKKLTPAPIAGPSHSAPLRPAPALKLVGIPPAAAPAGPAEPKRHDQKSCPRCGSFGCPCEGGSRLRTEGRYRYRRCSTCEWVFQTLQKHGSTLEEIIA